MFSLFRDKNQRTQQHSSSLRALGTVASRWTGLCSTALRGNEWEELRAALSDRRDSMQSECEAAGCAVARDGTVTGNSTFQNGSRVTLNAVVVSEKNSDSCLIFFFFISLEGNKTFKAERRLSEQQNKQYPGQHYEECRGQSHFQASLNSLYISCVTFQQAHSEILRLWADTGS